MELRSSLGGVALSAATRGLSLPSGHGDTTYECQAPSYSRRVGEPKERDEGNLSWDL